MARRSVSFGPARMGLGSDSRLTLRPKSLLFIRTRCHRKRFLIICQKGDMSTPVIVAIGVALVIVCGLARYAVYVLYRFGQL